MEAVVPPSQAAEGAIEQLRAAGTANRLKVLFRDSSVYGLSMAVSRLSALLIFPILARAFTTAEYGILDILNVFATVACFTVVLGQDSAVARFFFESDDLEERRRVIANAFTLQVASCIVVCGVLGLNAATISVMTFSEATHSLELGLAIANIPVMMVGSATQNLLKWTFDRRGFVAVTLGGTLAMTVLSVCFGVWAGMGVKGVLIGLLVGRTGAAVAGLWRCREWLRWRPEMSRTPALLAFGLPYMASGILSASFPALDRACILQGLGTASVGLYGAGFKVAMVLALPIAALQIAWNPMSLAIHRERNASATYDRVVLGSTVLFAWLALALTVMAEPTVILLASEKYRAGAAAVGPLTFGLVYRSLAATGGVGVDLAKRTYFGTLSNVAGLGVAWFAMQGLIRGWGIGGVAYGVLLGQVVAGGCFLVAARKVYPLRVALCRPHLAFVAFGGASVAIAFLPAGQGWAGVAVRCVIAVVAGGIVGSAVIPRADRAALMTLARGPRSRVVSAPVRTKDGV